MDLITLTIYDLECTGGTMLDYTDLYSCLLLLLSKLYYNQHAFYSWL